MGGWKTWQIDFDIVKNEAKEYNVEAMRKSAIYAQESKLDDLQGLHYLVSWKDYLDDKNTSRPYSEI